MEISFETRDTAIYREFFHQTRRAQETVESVVPDTDADIGKVAVVQSAVCLKSKDLTGHGVLISGEASASVLCICEGQTGVSVLRLKKPFTIEYEVENLELESLAQIALSVQGTDVRVVNPRKLSVTFEVEGALSCYRPERLCTDTALPADEALGLHARVEERSLPLPNAVCEKSLAVNEQFPLPTGGARLSRLVSERAELLVSDCQLIGSKIILKGSAEISVCAITEDVEEPRLLSFSTPFSQIIEVNTDSMSYCTVHPEITGTYFELVDTISGERVLDMELHAVMQLVCSETRGIRSITDIYSNLMPAEPVRETRSFELISGVQKRRMSAEERVSLTEECGELLLTMGSLSRVSQEGDKISAAVNLDFLYRNGAGLLSAGRRTLALSQELGGEVLRVMGARLVSLQARADGDSVSCSVMLELDCLSCLNTELAAVTGAVLDEEKRYAPESFPTLTLVRPEGETLWELAKRYRSSEEKIREYNGEAVEGAPILMIPKTV